MGRTLPSITMVFFQEQDSFARFRRALRRSDQSALDELFAADLVLELETPPVLPVQMLLPLV